MCARAWRRTSTNTFIYVSISRQQYKLITSRTACKWENRKALSNGLRFNITYLHSINYYVCIQGKTNNLRLLPCFVFLKELRWYVQFLHLTANTFIYCTLTLWNNKISLMYAFKQSLIFYELVETNQRPSIHIYTNLTSISSFHIISCNRALFYYLGSLTILYTMFCPI